MMKLYLNPRAIAVADTVEPPLERSAHLLMLSFLRLAVAALLVSGVFVVLVAIARTPLVELITGRGYLYTALVGHVVFALDIWLLSFAAVLWVLGMAHSGALPARIVGLGAVLAALGSALLAAVPLAGLGQPIMADYVPVLVHPVFLLGFGLFFAGIALPAVALLAALDWFRRTAATCSRSSTRRHWSRSGCGRRRRSAGMQQPWSEAACSWAARSGSARSCSSTSRRCGGRRSPISSGPGRASRSW
jgi:hypothetical protein